MYVHNYQLVLPNDFEFSDEHNMNSQLHVYNFSDGDTLIFIDFRADRMRQIVEAFGIKPQFETDKIPKDIVSTHRPVDNMAFSDQFLTILIQHHYIGLFLECSYYDSIQERVSISNPFPSWSSEKCFSRMVVSERHSPIPCSRYCKLYIGLCHFF